MKMIKKATRFILGLSLVSALTGCSLADIAIEDIYYDDAPYYEDYITDSYSEVTETDMKTDGPQVEETYPEESSIQQDGTDLSESSSYITYTFRNDKLLTEHYEKHGIEMGFQSKEEYEKAASDVPNNPNALHKTEVEDGDDVYYIEETNEFVIISTDGYIRTYFYPSAGIDYYNRQ